MVAFWAMKKFLFVIVFVPFLLSATVPDPSFTAVSCPGENKTQIHAKLSRYIHSLNAEFGTDNQHKIFAYMVGKTRNCDAVVYTLKIFIYDGEFHYALYFGRSAKDISDYCKNEIEVQMATIRTDLQKMFGTADEN